jgi:hypothetical protein
MWPGSEFCGWDPLEPGNTALQSALCYCCKRCKRGVDLIANVPIQSATSHLEIRRVPAALVMGSGRSPVVFTEGVDSSLAGLGERS